MKNNKVLKVEVREHYLRDDIIVFYGKDWEKSFTTYELAHEKKSFNEYVTLLFGYLVDSLKHNTYHYKETELYRFLSKIVPEPELSDLLLEVLFMPSIKTSNKLFKIFKKALGSPFKNSKKESSEKLISKTKKSNKRLK